MKAGHTTIADDDVYWLMTRGEPVYLPCDCSNAPDYECEDCIGMKNPHGCYCMAMGARQPGGPAA